MGSRTGSQVIASFGLWWRRWDRRIEWLFLTVRACRVKSLGGCLLIILERSCRLKRHDCMGSAIATA